MCAGQARRNSLRGLVSQWMGRSPQPNTLLKDEFFAVKDLSFQVSAGESIALIGRNGCGKTTTLKMLAGIIKPSGGKATLCGRVQSLINLGSGFSDSLSGRDNVLNGAAACGMGKSEANRIVGDVVEFAEIGDFINSPFGTYSSGMRARLGFSLAVHLNPDILLIDEILGVGDFAFQNRCFAKMNAIQKSGTTIVVVSHSHNRIIQMCERAYWLHEGRLIDSGPSDVVVTRYLGFLDELENKKHDNQSTVGKAVLLHQPGERTPIVDQRVIANAEHFGGRLESHPRVKWVRATMDDADSHGQPLHVHSRVILRVEFELAERIERLNLNLPIYRVSDGLHMTKLTTQETGLLQDVHEGVVKTEFLINDFNLADDDYVLVAAIFDSHEFIYRELLLEFSVCKGEGLFFPNNLLDFACQQSIRDGEPAEGSLQ